MASDIGVNLVVGATLSGSFQSVLGGVKKTLADLGTASEALKTKQTQLGAALSNALANPTASVGALRSRYEALGLTLDKIKAKSEALSRALAKGDALKESRHAQLSGMRETLGTTMAVGAPVIKAVMDAASFGDAVKDIAIVGELSADAEARLGEALRKSAINTNQSASDLAGGVGKLVAEGMDADKAASQADLLGRFTTASRASFEDAAKMMVSFDTLGVSAKNMELAFSQAAAAGKLGSFEVKDMAKWFPQLGGLMKGIGVTGNEAVVSMASRLQIAMKTAGGTDEAANNLKNFLAKLTSKDTIRAFDEIGIDLQGSMLRLARQGMDPIEGAVSLVMEQIGKQSPEVAAELAALSKEMEAIKDPAERAAEMERRRTMIEALGARTGMGEMFRDMQAVSYLLAEVQNRDQLKTVRKGTESGRTSDGTLAVDADFSKRMSSPLEQFKALKIGLTEIGMSIGTALLPPLLAMVDALRPGAMAIADFAKANPTAIKTIVGLGVALTAGKLAVLALGFGLNFLVLSPFHALKTAILTVGGRLLWFRALVQAGAFAGAGAKIGAFAALVGGRLVAALRVAGQAVLFLGRALLMNPIGLAVTAIAGAAYLIWRNWARLGPLFARLWDGIKSALASFGASVQAAFAGALGVLSRFGARAAAVIGPAWEGIKSALASFGASVQAAFAGALGALSRFGARAAAVIGSAVALFVSLPGKLRSLVSEMMSIGAAIMDGLIQGIKGKIGAAVAAIKSVGAQVRDSFKGLLGINSPSRVFLDFGGNLSEGLALGMSKKLAAVTKASAGLAAAATLSMAGATLAAGPVNQKPVPGSVAKGSPASSGALQKGKDAKAHREGMGGASITFAPNITINAAGADAAKVGQEVNKALSLSQAEFDRLMRRYEADKGRRAVK